MPELMLKPGWPAAFRRTVKGGKKPKALTFPPGVPVTVTEEEFAILRPEIGLVIFEIERDEKGRPRYVEAAVIDENMAAPSV